jgi:hypothetical protein
MQFIPLVAVAASEIAQLGQLYYPVGHRVLAYTSVHNSLRGNRGQLKVSQSGQEVSNTYHTGRLKIRVKSCHKGRSNGRGSGSSGSGIIHVEVVFPKRRMCLRVQGLPEAASSGVTGYRSAAMDESTFFISATLDSMIALATQAGVFELSSVSPIVR